MAELAIASGIAGLCSLVIESVKVTCAFGADIASAERTVLDYLSALRALEAVLVELNEVAQTPRLEGILSNRTQALSITAIQHCKQHVVELNQKLSRRLAEDGHIKLRSALSWPLKKKETMESVRLLHQYRDTFHAALSSEMMKISIATYDDVHATKEQVEREAVLKWLADDNNQDVVQSRSSIRHSGTCDWFMSLEAFKDWSLGAKEILWCHGSPGSGKSVLAAAVLKKLGENARCAFHAFDQQLSRTTQPEAVVRSLIKQLIPMDKELPPKLLSMFQAQQKSSPSSAPTKGELLSIFEKLCSQPERIFVVLDGLDECENRRQTLQLTASIASGGASVMVLSRKLPDIEEGLHTSNRLEYAASGEDLTNFINSRLEELEDELDEDLGAGLKNDVCSEVVKKSGGIFLLCRLIMDDIQSSVNVAQVRKSLNKLPANLSEMYQKTTDRLLAQAEKGMPRAKLALQTLSWVAFSARPLQIDELRHALAVEKNSNALNRENLTAAKIIVSVCLGLIKTDDQRQCTFVHLTAYDYFRQHFKVDEVNLNIARTCLDYLGFNAFAQQPCHDQQSMNHRLLEYPFALYSAQYLGFHARGCEPSLTDSLASILQHPISLQSLSQFFYFRHRKDEDLKSQSFALLPTGRAALQFACGAGLKLTAQKLLDAGAEVSSADDQGWCAMHSAASYGQPHMIELLLEKKADIEQRDNVGWTPLFWSAFKGHIEATRVLLKHGASSQVYDSSDWTPLHWAALKGDEAMIQLLKLDVSDRDRFLSNDWNEGLAHVLRPFFIAAERNNTETLNVMISTLGQSSLGPKTKLDVKRSGIEDVDDQKRLQKRNKILYRAFGKDRSYIKLPAPMEPSIALPESFLLQLLDSAIQANHLELVKMVLERDVNLTTDAYGELKGRSILHTSAFCTDARIPALLLEKGVTSVQTDEDGYYPIDLAAMNSSEPTLRVFMQETNANTTVAQSQVLLHIWGNRNLVPSINRDSELENGEDDTAIEGRKQARESMRLAVAKDLVALGANPMIRNNNGSVLHAAVRWGRAAIEYLASLKINLDTQDFLGQTVLHRAIGGSSNHEQTVAHLLNLGADPNTKDHSGRTPVLVALERGQFEIAKLLVETGSACTTIRDDRGYNCLHSIDKYRFRQLAKSEGLALVQYLVNACDPRAVVERCFESSGAERFPFELAFDDYPSEGDKGTRNLCSRALFHIALEVDRALVEAHLADEGFWMSSNNSSYYQERKIKQRQTYLNWKDEIGRGEMVFADLERRTMEEEQMQREEEEWETEQEKSDTDT